MKKIKFMYNGIKDVETRKLIPCYYGFHDKGRNIISIMTKNYDDLSKYFTNVINNSDSMTDYFEQDSVHITKESEYWNDCINAMIIHTEKRIIKVSTRKEKEKEAYYIKYHEDQIRYLNEDLIKLKGEIK